MDSWCIIFVILVTFVRVSLQVKTDLQLIMSPGSEIVFAEIGSNIDFECLVTPCIEVGNIALTFGEQPDFQKLFSGECNGEVQTSSRSTFSCDTSTCSYGIHVTNITWTDNIATISCLYGNGKFQLLQSRELQVYGKDSRDQKPRIEPVGPFYLMEEVEIRCTFDLPYPSDTLRLQCGERFKMATNASEKLEVFLDVTTDSRFSNDGCLCALQNNVTDFSEETILEPEILVGNFTSMSTLESFIDGQNETLECCSRGSETTNTTITFSCHGDEVSRVFTKKECVQFNVLVDVENNGSICTCTVLSDDESIVVVLEKTMNIAPYTPKLELQENYTINFGSSLNIQCRSEELHYPFAFGPWTYRNHDMIQAIIDDNATDVESSIYIRNVIYNDMGVYNCHVIDGRKDGDTVMTASTIVKVNGPIRLSGVHFHVVDDQSCTLHLKFTCYPEPIVKSIWQGIHRLEKVQRVEDANEHFYSLIPYRHSQTFQLHDCSNQTSYGLIVDNGYEKKTFYFSYEGEIVERNPMIEMANYFFDGKPATITCYDITDTESSLLLLTCGNISNAPVFPDSDIAVVRLSFIADLDDDETKCVCHSNRTGHTSSEIVRIIPYTSDKLEVQQQQCDSSSRVQLACSDENLPGVFKFKNWVHHFNGVVIRTLPGIIGSKSMNLDIPFCTFEDNGNYTCIVEDSRNSKTVMVNYTTFLYVPGPPVITQKTFDTSSCSLYVEFYSFDVTSSRITWYKDGVRLHSEEGYRLSLDDSIHNLTMYNKTVHIKGKRAVLRRINECDLEKNEYKLYIKNSFLVVSHTFTPKDSTVQNILVLSLTIVTLVLLAGLAMILCKSNKGMADEQGQVYRDSDYDSTYERIPLRNINYTVNNQEPFSVRGKESSL